MRTLKKMEAGVESRARELSDELDGAVGRINARTFQSLRPTRATISTMTITASLNVKRVCKDSMVIALSLVDGDGPLTAAKTHKRKRTAVFFNQITLRHGTKSVKVFFNGSMHVTGCTSPMQFADIASAVCGFMADVAGVETVDGTSDVRVTGFDIQMINLNFGAGSQLHLQSLRDRCAAKGYAASYDSDMYPGLNVKVPVGDKLGDKLGDRHATILLFKSGKVIVTGAKSASELEEAHALITSVLDEELTPPETN